MKNLIIIFLSLLLIYAKVSYATWSLDLLPIIHNEFKEGVTDVDFLNPNLGFSLKCINPISTFNYYNDIKIYKTTNQSENWELLNSDLNQYSLTPPKIKYINENIGFLVTTTRTVQNNSQYFRLFKTTNQGLNWTQISDKLIGDQISLTLFPKLNFLNENLGFVLLYPNYLFKTTDGGFTFTEILNSNSYGNRYFADFTANLATNELIVVGGSFTPFPGTPLLLYSNDMGATFEVKAYWNQNSHIGYISCIDHTFNSTEIKPILATRIGLFELNLQNGSFYPQTLFSNYFNSPNYVPEIIKLFEEKVCLYSQNRNFSGNNYILKSIDGGLNFEIIYSTNSYFERISNLCIFNDIVYASLNFENIGSDQNQTFILTKKINHLFRLVKDGYVSEMGSFTFKRNNQTNYSTPLNIFLRGGTNSYLNLSSELNNGNLIFYNWNNGMMNSNVNIYSDGDNEMIYSQYKTKLLSNKSSAFSSNSQNKSIKDTVIGGNGTVHQMHESIGGIFYSRSTDNGATFSREEIVNFYSDNASGNKNSFINVMRSYGDLSPISIYDANRNVAAVWEYYNSTTGKNEIKVANRKSHIQSGYEWGIYVNGQGQRNFTSFDADANFESKPKIFVAAQITDPTNLPAHFILVPHLKKNGSETQLVVAARIHGIFEEFVIDNGLITDFSVSSPFNYFGQFGLHFAYRKNNKIYYAYREFQTNGSSITQQNDPPAIVEVSEGDGVSIRHTPDISLRNGKPVIGYRGFKNTIHIIQQEDGSGGGISQEQLVFDRYPIIVRYQDPSGNWVNATHYNSLPYSTQENPNVEGSKNGNAHIVNFSKNGNSFRQFVKIDGESGFSPSPNTFNGTDAKLVRGSYSGTTTTGSLLTLSPENSLYRVGRQNFTITNTPIINVFDNVAGVITLEDLDYLFTLGPVLVKNTIIGHDREKVIESHITNPVEFNSSMISNTFSMSDGDTLILGAYGSFIPTVNEFNLNPLRYTVNLVNNTTSEIHRELFSDTITASDSIEIDFFRGFIINDIENTTDSFYVQLIVNPEDLSEGDYYLNGVYQGESEEAGLGDGFDGITNFTRKIFFEGLGNSVPGLANIPDQFALTQNYPNPFNPVTNISFSIPVEGLVKLKVFDITGREVAVLVNELKTPGSYNVSFNGSTLSSGVYFYRIEAGTFVETKRMLLIK